VAYHFSAITSDGRSRDVVRAERNVPAYARFASGDPVRVRYLPDKPEICRIEIEE